MQILRYPEVIEGGTALTIGSFDGLHKAHRAIIGEVVRRANMRNVPSCVVSFWPLPQQVVHKGFSFFLTTLKEKEELLEELGIDILYLIEFTPELMRVEAQDFFMRYIFNPLRPKVVVVGPGHRFGYKRRGSPDFLKELSYKLGFEFKLLPSYRMGGTPISSTRIREQLLLGNVRRANELLGWEYFFSGRVIGGEKRGRRIGFPTLNLLPLDEKKLLPADGVYAVRVLVKGKEYPGVMYIGYRPTFGGETRSLEVHIFDVKRGIYPQEVRVDFVERLRGEEKFRDVSLLTKQIERDIGKAKKILKGNP